MDNTKQAEVLQKVLELEKGIIATEKLIARARTEKYEDAPTPPTRNMVTRTYPEVTSTVVFDKKKAFIPVAIGLVVPFVLAGLSPIFIMVLGFTAPASIIWLIYYYFGVYRKEKNANIESIKNSAEYKSKCAELDKEFDEIQAENDKVYENQKLEYENNILPEYEKKLAEWTEMHFNYIEKEETNLRNAETELATIYAETKIVPIQYRNIEALQYITDMVCSSDYDVKQAIENYDKKVQRDLDIIKIEEQQRANELADEQAYLLQEQNKIAEKARRDANIASVVGTVQRHNTNKILKGK